MSYADTKYVVLYQKNWTEALRTAKRLSSSLQRLASDFPISSASLVSADDDLQDKIDAFRVRFADLQDCIGHKLFRNLLKLEEETPISMVDVLNMMEKRSVLSSPQQWKLLREVRNAFSHDYPESEHERSEALNLAWQHADQLLVILVNLQHYVHSIGIELEGDINALIKA
ncbi:MAG: hypothetical protein HRT95_19075 [Moritella sp.]|uniref:hypothetical protein n=1 Tax=Moritella sp. TaxID=78556 RepID=UPI001D36A064|nr:hypothetical protein [Moritella sp.]NQZ52191.1 hypothetical protein [Moritella sp.]